MSILKYRALLGLSLAVLLAACSTTPMATMDFDPGVDFSSVRKITIQPINRTVASQAILSDMQIDRVNASLTAELSRRGFQVVPNNTDADMLLAWHLVTQERMDVRTFNSSTRYNCWNCRRMGMGSSTNVTVRQYTQGTFIVDMIDPTMLQAVWRSVFESRMRDHSVPARATEARDAAVAAALAEFPPK
jgi:hypothetical protein